MFQPVDDACQIRFEIDFGADVVCNNVFGRTLTTTLTQGVADDIANEAEELYGGLLGKMADEVTVRGITVTDLRTEGAPEFFTDAHSFPQVGTATGQPLPPQVAALLSWQTALRGRSYRGRTYLVGFAENFSDGRSVDSAIVASMESARDAILAFGTWGVISRFHDGVQRPTGVINTFTGGTAHSRWRTQRRRAHPTL